MPDSVRPHIVVITTIFGHSTLVVEAIESTRRQVFDGIVHHILVNDGCPDPSTDIICKSYARSFPSLISYLRTSNIGLSASRNLAIDFARGTLSAVDAYFFLDADNRLLENALSIFWSALVGSNDADWVYADLRSFGVRGKTFFPRKHSLLLLLSNNYYDSSCLIRSRLIESGLRFDESFRDGLEDWDFFLSASLKGSVGCYSPSSGFRYRRRFGSMLVDTAVGASPAMRQLRNKHSQAFTARQIADLEHRENPRFAYVCTDSSVVFLFSDPEHYTHKVLSYDDYRDSLESSARDQLASSPPQYVITGTKISFETLNRARISCWAFWRMESECGRSSVSVLNFDFTKDVRILGQVVEEPVAFTFADFASIRERRSLDLFFYDWADNPALNAIIFSLRKHIPPLPALPHSVYLGVPDAIVPRNVLNGAVSGHVPIPSSGRSKMTRIGIIANPQDIDALCAALLPILSERSCMLDLQLFIISRRGLSNLAPIDPLFSSVFFLHEDLGLQSSSIASYLGSGVPYNNSPDLTKIIYSIFYHLDEVIVSEDDLTVPLSGHFRGLRIPVSCFVPKRVQSCIGDWLGSVLAYEHNFSSFIFSSRKHAREASGRGIPEYKIAVAREVDKLGHILKDS